MRYPTTIRSAIVAVVPLLAGIGLSAQTVFGAPLNPVQPVPIKQPAPVASLQPPVTTFNGTYQSPNGHFTFSLTDNGIVLSGPGGSVRIDETSVQVSGSNNVTITAAGSVTVNASASAQVTASMVTLNGSCSRVARAGDLVLVNVPPATPATQVATGSIVLGSSTVFAC
jgi:hypothetical protein